jgi:hypothetical protein
MKVHELKKELDEYPDDMEVSIRGETVGGDIPIEFVSDDYVVHSKDPLDHTHYVILVIDASRRR